MDDHGCSVCADHVTDLQQFAGRVTTDQHDQSIALRKYADRASKRAFNVSVHTPVLERSTGNDHDHVLQVILLDGLSQDNLHPNVD